MTSDTANRKTYDITVTAESRGLRELEDDGTRWEHYLWDVTLTHEGRTFTFPMRMGTLHAQTRCGKPKPYDARFVVRPERVCNHVRCEQAGWVGTPPDLYDVLTSLKADSTGGESFYEWASSLGYDDDSMKARETYLACQKQEDAVIRLLGAEKWAAILADDDYT